MIALVGAIATITGVVQAQGRELPIRPHVQHTMVWCWGASVAMAVEHETGRPIEDCEVLSAYDRSRGGAGMCCLDPTPCLRGAIPGEIENILGGVFDIRGRSQTYPASFDEVRAHIETGHPLILWLWQSQTTAHVVVVAGYRDDGTLLVLDPMQGPAWVPYAVLRANWRTGEWRHTIFVGGRGGTVPDVPYDPAPPYDPGPVPAHWCCTMFGRFGPYLPNDVPVGAMCNWMTPRGPVSGTACN